ncbi:hypothetical protein [Tetragenococcus koreensis]|uniref:hypothetical protein n=1 Tax=Tetragenococcus koreensis TaxID=290335 RepID=UPI001F2085D7|nr:hypothetical protein [Tetragenococcus koreensis]MCF1633095.1 hypothetical protein [Tetragenococcus koreensis]
MNKEEFVINTLAQRIAQLETDKASLQADYLAISEELKQLRKEDDEDAKND